MNSKTKHGEDRQWHYRLLVLSRIAAAIVGGYALSTAMILALTYSLPIVQKDALMLSTMLSYLFYVVAIIWVFSVKTVTRAWVGMIGGTCALGILAFLLHHAQS